VILPLRTPQARVAPRPPGAVAAGAASAFVPGLGQLLQRRYGTALLHCCSVGAYAIAAWRFGGGWWSLGALLFNVWSVLDAAWWARESGHDDEPVMNTDSPSSRHEFS